MTAISNVAEFMRVFLFLCTIVSAGEMNISTLILLHLFLLRRVTPQIASSESKIYAKRIADLHLVFVTSSAANGNFVSLRSPVIGHSLPSQAGLFSRGGIRGIFPNDTKKKVAFPSFNLVTHGKL